MKLYFNVFSILLSIFTLSNAVLAEEIKTKENKTSESTEVIKEEINCDLEDKKESDTFCKEVKNNEPTPEEIARYEKLAAADKLYKEGDKIAARKLYQEVKETWSIEKYKGDGLPEPIYKPEDLSPAGKVHFRNYKRGQEQGLKTKILVSLKLLTESDPQFIPGHIYYGEELISREKETEGLAVLEKALGLYPNEVPLLKAKINADIKTEKWIDASIAARQFALFNPDKPEAEEFTKLADEYLVTYQKKIKEELTWNAIGNGITGVLGFALTGNLFGPFSAIDTTVMLLRGESSIGDSISQKVQKALPLVEDEEVLNYVREIGNKVASVAGRDEFEYEFFVVMDDNLNAFALPGGKIFVNAGAIMETESEAELAGLLAHEVAHSVLSHGFQLATRGNLTSNVFQYIPYVGGTAGGLIVLNYSRDMERQADIFGTKVLAATNYSADGVSNLMEKLVKIHSKDEENSEPPAWLSTHPNSKQRVLYMQELIVKNNLNRYGYEGVEQHKEIKGIVNKLWEEYKAEQEEKEKKDKKKKNEEPLY